MGKRGTKKPTECSSGAETITAGESSTTGENLVDIIVNQVRKTLQAPDIIASIVNAITENVTKAVIEELKSTMDFNNNLISELKLDIKKKESELLVLRKELQESTDELEQYQRRNSLRIFGISEVINEDTDQIAVDLITQKLGVQMAVSNIDRSHRVGRKVPGMTRPIIVKFTTYNKQIEVFKNKRKLAGSGITIREDLTARRLDLLRVAIGKFGVKQVWSSDGRIIVIKDNVKHQVKSVDEITRL